MQDIDVLLGDNDRQHKAVELFLTRAHQECPGYRRYGQHTPFGLRPGQIVMKKPVHHKIHGSNVAIIPTTTVCQLAGINFPSVSYKPIIFGSINLCIDAAICCTVSLPTPTMSVGVGRIFEFVCLFVCLSVWLSAVSVRSITQNRTIQKCSNLV